MPSPPPKPKLPQHYQKPRKNRNRPPPPKQLQRPTPHESHNPPPKYPPPPRPYIKHTPTKTSPRTLYPSVAAPILNFSIFKGFAHYFLKTHNQTPDLIT